MIIAAHAGTGKTRFAKTVYDSVQTLFRREMIRIDESGEIPAHMKKGWLYVKLCRR